MSFVKEDLIQIISSLDTLAKETASFFAIRIADQYPESKAVAELTSFDTKSVQTAYSQGDLLIEGSVNHLIALLRSLTEPVLTIAPWSIVRTIMESSALASWLLDPFIDAQERVKRSFSFRFEGLTQQLKFFRVAGINSGRLLSRIDEIDAQAIHLDFPRIENLKGERIGIGQRFPKMTGLIGSVLKEEATYRLLSAFTHSHPWAISQLSFIKSKENYLKDNIFAHNTTSLEWGLRPESTVFLCHKASFVYARPIWYKAQLYGYEIRELTEMLNNVFDSLRAPTTRRFWNG